MRYLRMLSNSLVAGALATSYELTLVLQLNPTLSPGWLSVGVLAQLGGVASVAGAALMWTNLQTFSLVIEPDLAQQMLGGTVMLVAASALFAAVALLRAQAYPSGRTAWALLYLA